MTQTFTGPDGQDYDFPDEMSQDAIKGVMAKKFGGPGVPPSSAGTSPTPVGALPAGASSAGTPAGSNQPTLPANPSTGDMPFELGQGPTMQGTADTLRTFNRNLTHGLWDPAVGAAKSLLIGGPMGDRIAAEREATKQAEANVGPVPGMVGSWYDPANKILAGEQMVSGITSPIMKWLARPFAHALTGATFAGTKAVAENQPVGPAMREGGATNAVVGPFVGGLTDTPRAPAPTTADFKTKVDAADQNLANIRYNQSDVLATARSANIAGTKAQLNPDIDRPITRLHNQFTAFAKEPANEMSVKQLLDYRDKANSIGGTEMVDAIDNHLANVTPTKGALSSDAVGNAIDASNMANKNLATSQQLDQLKLPPKTYFAPSNYVDARNLVGKGTYTGEAAQNVGTHAYRIAHGVLEPIAAGLGFTGHFTPAALVAGTAIAGAPGLQWSANRIAQSQVPRLAQNWASRTQGAPPAAVDQNWQRALQSMVLGAQ